VGQLPVVHLAKRFFGSLSPAPPSAADRAWVEEVLLPGELDVWRRMSKPDQRHAAGVARRVAVSRDEREVLAAALLHDSGKVVSGLGTFGRVAATLIGRKRAKGRMALYLRHDELGAELLEKAGSDRLTIAWAREHHLPRDRWTVPQNVGDVLKAADDD
jgi:hypothetical protein